MHCSICQASLCAECKRATHMAKVFANHKFTDVTASRSQSTPVCCTNNRVGSLLLVHWLHFAFYLSSLGRVPLRSSPVQGHREDNNLVSPLLPCASILTPFYSSMLFVSEAWEAVRAVLLAGLDFALHHMLLDHRS